MPDSRQNTLENEKAAVAATAPGATLATGWPPRSTAIAPVDTAVIGGANKPAIQQQSLNAPKIEPSRSADIPAASVSKLETPAPAERIDKAGASVGTTRIESAVARPELIQKLDRVEQVEKVERAEKSEKVDRIEAPAVEKVERVETSKIERVETPKVEKVERVEASKVDSFHLFQLGQVNPLDFVNLG